MKKYIDAEKLKNEICKNKLMSKELIAQRILHIIDEQPAADVAEIVRCKDCKHFDEKLGKCYGQDIRAEEGHDCYKNDDDFCSCSERK